MSDKFGLAFSGGGIRSSTFNLGVLKRFVLGDTTPTDKTVPSDNKVPTELHHFDYLSSVSGGGYTTCGFFSHWRNDPAAPCKQESIKSSFDRFRKHMLHGVASVYTPFGMAGAFLCGFALKLVLLISVTFGMAPIIVHYVFFTSSGDENWLMQPSTSGLPLCVDQTNFGCLCKETSRAPLPPEVFTLIRNRIFTGSHALGWGIVFISAVLLVVFGYLVWLFFKPSMCPSDGMCRRVCCRTCVDPPPQEPLSSLLSDETASRVSHCVARSASTIDRRS